MKKIFLICLLAMVLALAGCNNKEKIKVLTPSGAPALAQIFLQENQDRYLTDIVNGPDALVAGFGAANYDFIIAPINLGAKLYNNNIDYQLIAGVTFGNFYLATVTDWEFNLEFLEGKEVICFGQNAVSDIVLQYVLLESGIDVDITYVDSLTSANAMLLADNSKIILSAEPALSVLKNNIVGLKTIDIQEEYLSITENDYFPQAAVFAKKSLSSRLVSSFLKDLEISIVKVNDDLEATAALATELEYGFLESVLISAIPKSNIDFVLAKDMKEDVISFLDIIMDLNPALIGNKLPDEDFYR
jgi:NitT/TauT family transport system substrate-binding protein